MAWKNWNKYAGNCPKVAYVTVRGRPVCQALSNKAMGDLVGTCSHLSINKAREAKRVLERAGFEEVRVVVGPCPA